jgi:hypothetical protein
MTLVDEAYDPGQYTVDEVKSYVEDNLTEAQSIRDAEAAGKNRSTLISWLDEQMGGTPEEAPEEPDVPPAEDEPDVEEVPEEEEPVPEQQERSEFRSP